ncbi:MAG: hypothetical protein ACYS7Y_25330 [Planctomycetota bacterium]|jgi:hypothetical protein
MARKKTGKATKADKEYLAANSEMAVADLAAHLNRSEAFVRKHLASVPVEATAREKDDWISRLHSSSFWLDIKKGLISSEVGYFENAWASYINQFGSASDILATDELMIKDLVMLDIFSQRAIAEQANMIRRISMLERDIAAEEDKDVDDRDAFELGQWRTTLSSLLAAKAAVSKQHLDYQQRKDAKLRDLKGSRDQRFKQIEESRKNIFELIKELDTQRRRTEEGRLAEKVRLAAQHVAHDWNQVMEFEDGTLDKPFLSPEGELEDARLQNEQEQADRLENPDSHRRLQFADQAADSKAGA